MDDALTHFIWTPYYLKDQGNEIHDNVIYQDNESIINWRRMADDKLASRLAIYYFITYRTTNQE